jgi:hypothetical protein
MVVQITGSAACPFVLLMRVFPDSTVRDRSGMDLAVGGV